MNIVIQGASASIEPLEYDKVQVEVKGADISELTDAIETKVLLDNITISKIYEWIDINEFVKYIGVENVLKHIKGCDAVDYYGFELMDD